MSQTIINAARGQSTYHQSRHKIAQSLFSNEDTDVGAISPFHLKQLLKIKPENWVPIRFDRKDWPTIDKLRAGTDATAFNMYLHLLQSYIVVNAKSVKNVYAASRAVSAGALQDNSEILDAAISSLPHEDQRSLFSYKVISARSSSTDTLLKFFQSGIHSGWTRKRFLYPLVYYYFNNPNDSYLDTLLSYVINGDVQSEAERVTIRFLLRDEIVYDENIGFKAYVALLCHPFDACEMLLNHIELKIFNDEVVSEDLKDAIDIIASVISTPRLDDIKNLLHKIPVKVATNTGADDLRRYFELKADEYQALIDIADYRVSTVPDLPNGSKLLKNLIKLRNSYYTAPTEYRYVVSHISKWQFTDAFRYIRAFLTSLYLLPRREKCHELREIYRLISFLGSASPFVVAAPGGVEFFEKGFAPIEQNFSFSDLELLVDAALENDLSGSGRLWIKAVHWKLRDSRRNVRLSEWFDGVRENIRISPAYLTGISWKWLDQAFKITRLRPFIGNRSAIYTLLIGQIEDPSRDAIILRAAIEPLSKNRTLAEFVDFLIIEYQQEATYFVRHFLTVENILLLQLAPNETAALSGRITALETCVRKFGFNEALEENEFLNESKTLTAALMLSRVTSGQFEVPWEIFKIDASEKNILGYDAYTSMGQSSHGLRLLGNSTINTPHKFRNGKIVEYAFENQRWPIVLLVISVIETFMEHPSFGIEVLLSTRIRHDTIRREYFNALSDVKDSYIAGVPSDAQQAIVENIELDLYNTIDAWLFAFMQTKRPGKPHALFDFAPSQHELSLLVSYCEACIRYEDVVAAIIKWLRERLDAQVLVAKESFNTAFKADLTRHIRQVRDSVEKSDDFRTADISRMFSAVDAVVVRLTENLSSWFSAAPSREQQPFNLAEIKIAVDGLFESQIQSGTLKVYFPEKLKSSEPIPQTKVRLSFDLLSELFHNALKHGSSQNVRLRISSFNDPAFSGWVFSSTSKLEDPVIWRLEGERYTSLTEAIFREGNSGLPKIAALSATLVGGTVGIQAVRKRRSFHLFVPFWRKVS